MSDWKIFLGNQTDTHDRIDDLPEPPDWRKFGRVKPESQFNFVELPNGDCEKTEERG